MNWKRSLVVAIVIGAFALAVVGSVYPTVWRGAKNVASGTSDIVINPNGVGEFPDGKLFEMTIIPAGADVGVSFWYMDPGDSTWSLLLPDSVTTNPLAGDAMSDTLFPIPIATFGVPAVTFSFPYRGRYPNLARIDRSSATAVKVYWR